MAAGAVVSITALGQPAPAKADDPCTGLVGQTMTVTGTVTSVEEDFFMGYDVGVRDTNVGCVVHFATEEPPQCGVGQGVEVSGVLKSYGDSNQEYWLEGSDPYYCR
ncbi:MAG TPA: hypothetical protein VI732_04540 [Alphaproteobacteria bacterium]|nr:hypothetical protein [Alphaproteobacteria bacterium]